MTEIVRTKDPSGLVGFGVLIFIAAAVVAGMFASILPVFAIYAILGIGSIVIIAAFFVVIKQYEKGIILRFGKYIKTIDHGLQYRIPFVDRVYVVDTREKVRQFQAEDMLTKDNVPVKIDSIMKYKVKPESAKDAVLNVEDFDEIIKQSSQTALRTSIGSSELQKIIAERDEVNEKITSALTKETSGWGVQVTGVEIRNLVLPEKLENAMSSEAQAEREKRARQTYSESEIAVAENFKKASEMYADNPLAYSLRQSNMLHESLKVKGNTIVLVPTEQLNQIGYGNVAMIEAFMQQREKVKQEKKSE